MSENKFQHLHIHEECHDPNCTEHHHHHHDEECHDPNCTEHHHHHNKHEDAVKDSLIMSCSRSFTVPRTGAELRRMGEETFLHLGQMICVEGVVAGHLKGVIEAEQGSIAFSLTRAGVVDVTELSGWDGLDTVDSYTMTVNIMSIIPAEVTEEDIFCYMK